MINVSHCLVKWLFDKYLIGAVHLIKPLHTIGYNVTNESIID